MNKIVICGRIVKNPELRATNSGTEVCNFTVAVDRRAKKGEESITDFIDCTAWARTGVFVNTYFHKGDGITVEGRMESTKWVNKDGENRTSWGVTCDNVEFALGKGKIAQAEPATGPLSELNNQTPVDVNLDDGDLPF